MIVGAGTQGGGIRIVRKREVTGWTNVTPATANLTLDFGASGHPVVHPTEPNKVYIGYDQDGVYESTDYGATFTRVSGSGSMVEEGAIWFLALSPDGATMVAGHGHDSTSGRHQKLIVSNDLGRTWYEGSADLGFQPYDCKFDPDDSSRAIFTTHTDQDGDVYLSENMHLTNGAITVTSIGDTGLSHSCYAFWGETADTIIAIAEDDDGGANQTRRSTLSGSWSAFNGVAARGHFHGSFDPYVDRVAGRIYLPSASGIDISDDDGATWSSLLGSVNLASVHKRGAVIVAGLSYALGSGGEFGPNIRLSTNSGGSFSTESDPAGMDNGPRAWASTVNASGQYVFICNCWCSGTHRLVVNP